MTLKNGINYIEADDIAASQKKSHRQTPLPKCACNDCRRAEASADCVTTQADPNGLEIGQPGAKTDAGKPDASLLADFGRALMAVAEVATFGRAVKGYARGGWLQVPNGEQRYLAAMLRHTFATEQTDSESGLSHAKHCAWNSLARLELLLRQEVKQVNGIP